MNGNDLFLKFFLFIPTQCFKQFRITKARYTNTFKHIANIFKTKLIFIHRGKLIHPDIDENDCKNIQNNEIVVAIPEKFTAQTERIKNWQKLTKDDEEFRKTVFYLTKKNTREEMMRLKDISIFKSMNRPKCFHKTCKRFADGDIDSLNDMENNVIPFVSDSVTDVTPALEICEDPLPAPF